MMQVKNGGNTILNNSSYYSPRNTASDQVNFRNLVEIENNNLKTKSMTKEDILKKFPALDEDDLDTILKNYDIERMSSSELYKLADELMEKDVIPSYAHREGLELIAVYPKSLCDAIQNGDTTSMSKGTITEAPDYLYTVNQNTGELTYYGYPEFGLKNLQYGIHLTQEAFRAYASYYTNEERNRALQIEESKQAFYELADMIASYQKEE